MDQVTPTTPPLTAARPGEDGYDDCCRTWNVLAQLHPAQAITVTSVEEAAAAVRHAAEQGLRITTMTTGHLVLGLPPLDGVLLVRTALHQGTVEVDPQARTARVLAGALWGDVAAAAAEHGLVGLHGSSPTVGVIGYLLGGGVSFYGRSYGLAANHVRAIEVVTADGGLRRVDADHEPELFWALRGGGGGFGIVTAVEIDLFAVEQAYAGTLFWPIGHARQLLRAWRTWCATAPDEITTAFRILCLPPLPQVPEPLRQTPVVAIDGVLLGDAARGEELLRPLREAAPAMFDTWTMIPGVEVGRVHGDPEDPLPALMYTAMLGALDDDAIDAFLAVTGEGSGSPLVAGELRQMGGAMARAPEGAGVVGSLSEAFLVGGVAIAMDPPSGEAVQATFGKLDEALAPFVSGRTLLTWDERPGSARSSFPADDYERLREVRARVDPDATFLTVREIS